MVRVLEHVGKLMRVLEQVGKLMRVLEQVGKLMRYLDHQHGTVEVSMPGGLKQ